MNGRQIIKKAVAFESTPRTPVAYIDGGTWVLHNEKLSMRELLDMKDAGADILCGYYDAFNPDIVWAAPSCYNYAVKALGGEIEDNKKGKAPEMAKSFIREGDSISEMTTSEIKSLLKKDSDIQKMILQTKNIAKRYKGEKYIAINYVGPFTLASQLVGMTDFMMLLCGENDDLSELLQMAENICGAFYEIFLGAGADMVFIGEPTSSGDLISPEMFEKFSLPHITNLCKKISKKAEIILLHICGDTKNRVTKLINSGIDGFSVDSIDIKKAMDDAQKDFAIFGNMSPVDIICNKSFAEVEKICKDIAQKGGLSGGFALMPGCDIAPQTPSENILAMINAARKNYYK